jgi:hypothetical protein
MASVADVLIDGFGRVRPVVHATAAGLTPDQLAFRPGDSGNSIGWLIWHLTRIQDAQVSEVAGFDQVWHSGGWAERFGLPFSRSATGYGHSSNDVAAVRITSPDLLIGYFEAVHEKTLRYVRGLSGIDLDAVVDERWDPPVTLGVRLVSVISDALQHAGQAAYVRGLLLAG